MENTEKALHAAMPPAPNVRWAGAGGEVGGVGGEGGEVMTVHHAQYCTTCSTCWVATHRLGWDKGWGVGLTRPKFAFSLGPNREGYVLFYFVLIIITSGFPLVFQ